MVRPKRDRTILVTGSSGLIGSRVVERFHGEFNVVGFDNAGPPYPPIEAECISADLTDDESVRRALARVEYEYGKRIASVIHLAAYYSFSGEESPLYDKLTVGGTERVFRIMREMGFEMEQFLFSSTMLVHKPCEPGQWINEDWPIEPAWEYPRSKVDTENLLRRIHGDVPIVLMRIAGVYDDSGHSIPIAHQIQRIYERRVTSHVYPGDLSHGQAFVHLDDTVEAIWLAVERRAQLPAEFPVLIGEPDPIPYGELQQILGRLIHGEDWETRQIPKTLAEAGAWVQDHLIPGYDPFIKPWMIDRADDHFALDIARARRELGWEPKRSLRETLPKMAALLKSDPQRFYEANKLKQ